MVKAPAQPVDPALAVVGLEAGYCDVEEQVVVGAVALRRMTEQH